MLMTDFTTLQITGTKTRAFLHQLCTQDLLRQADVYTYAAFLNNQGRVVFDAYIRFIDDQTAWLILPCTMLESVQSHLSQYAAFSRVTLLALKHNWSAEANGASPLPHLPYTLSLTDQEPTEINAWHYTEICHGIPRIRLNNQEKFTAHMLNLNYLGAMSFQKGCYLGQEITHRTEMLGKTKKGLYRGYTEHPQALLLSLVSKPETIGLYVVDHNLALTIPELTRLH